MKKNNMKKVIVIGGGIIGLSIAEKLNHEGMQVTIIEKEKIAAGASYGNAAGFAFSEIMPLASPATIKKSIGWFLDPEGPFAVVPKDLPKTLGWLIRFALSARSSMYKNSTETLSNMMNFEKQTLKRFHHRTGLDSMVTNKGALYLYEKESQFEADLLNWKFREQHGIEFETYKGDALHEFQSDLSANVIAGIYVPSYPMVTNPNDYCQAIHQLNQNNGVEVLYEAVESIQHGNKPSVILKNGLEINADKIILASGPWSATLTEKLGDKVSLVGERGYNTTFPKSALPNLERTLFFPAHGFVMTPLADGIRVGGASEIASLDRASNFKRSKNMLTKALRFIPNLRTEDGKEWMGMRPTMPDTLPVISRSKHSDDIIYAFGHGHLGLTLASSTAQLVSDIINGNKPEIDIRALRVDRFSLFKQ